MGVTSVLSYPIPENKTCQQVLESLYKLMEVLGAKQCGTFKIDCETFISASNLQPTPKQLQLFHDTEKPLSTFSLIDNGKQYLIADNGSFDTIVQTYLSQVYPCKKSQKIESSGKRFDLSEGDFFVRIGQVMQEHSLRGITIEIDFTPCHVASNCWDIICQVAQNFLPMNQMPPMPQTDLFLPIDTIRQYQFIFNKLRKQT